MKLLASSCSQMKQAVLVSEKQDAWREIYDFKTKFRGWGILQCARNPELSRWERLFKMSWPEGSRSFSKVPEEALRHLKRSKWGDSRFWRHPPTRSWRWLGCVFSHTNVLSLPWVRHFLCTAGFAILPFFFFPLLRELSKICSQPSLPYFLSGLSHTPIYGNSYHIANCLARTFYRKCSVPGGLFKLSNPRTKRRQQQTAADIGVCVCVCVCE